MSKKGERMAFIYSPKSFVLSFVFSLMMIGATPKILAGELVSESTLFDYSNAIANLDSQINSAYDELGAVIAQIALIESVDGYSSLVSAALDDLLLQENDLNNLIAELQTVQTELIDITTLPSATKDQLYYFYTVLACDYHDFMVRVPFNYQAALNDPTIIALLNDTANSAEVKNALALLVYQNYPIYPDHLPTLIRMYPFLP